jgi:hypothetical protein
MDVNEISKIVLDAAIAVHKTLGGPGLLESVYQINFGKGTLIEGYQRVIN